MRSRLTKNVCYVMVALMVTQATPALAIDKIYSPNFTKGEMELEYSGNTTFDKNHDKNGIQGHEVELEYGLTNHVTLELNGSFDKQPSEALRSDAVGFGGRYQLFDQGEYWLDAGLLVSYGRAVHDDTDADSVEAKVLLEKQTGSFLHRLNFGIEQEVGSHSEGGPDRVVMGNSRYRLNKHFEPGIEMQSDFGKPNQRLSFNQQEHYIGPALYGQIIPRVNYEAAYYVGLTDAASKGAARVLVEYEMFF